MDPETPPKLRMAPRQSAEDLARRRERENRAVNLQREAGLERSLGDFRVGSVRFLNAVPLTRGLEEQILFATPSELGAMLQRDQLDAAMVSVTEVLQKDRYDVLDGIAIASLGEVQSVLLAHRGPLEQARQVHCDPASLTSVNLVKVLLAERGIFPEYVPLRNYKHDELPDYALVIGDPALDLLLDPGRKHDIWDLGSAWFDLTQLPFVFAVWALRRGIDNSPLRRQLREARDFGLDTLEEIIRERSEYDYDFRKDYLGWHIHYHLGADEKRAIAVFMQLLDKHRLGPVFAPRYVA